ncbi:MAG: hypothetical protein SGPRY_003189, partial [Prymnesium sp.]
RRPAVGLWKNARLSRLPPHARHEMIRHPKLLMLGAHLAAIELQRFFCGYLMRILISLLALDSNHPTPPACKRAAFARARYRALRKRGGGGGLSTRVPGVRETDVGLVARYLEAKGDPAELLRCINPQEAKLIEPGANLHVRFRLGGSQFPPIIYYKLFTHGPVADIGSFAPRDYTDHFQPPPLILHNHSKPGQAIREKAHSGWYRRIENNGWRPVARNGAGTVGAKPVIWHHSRLVRRQHLEERRKQKKMHWWKTMYAKGRLDDGRVESLSGAQLDRRTMGEGEGEEEEIDALLDWSTQLNFDTYVANWQVHSALPIDKLRIWQQFLTLL